MEILTKIANKNYRLDLTNRRIDFLDNRFYYDEAGNAFPSVTTILNAFPKTAQFFEFLKKNGENADDIRDEAGRKGTRVHDMTQKYDEGHEVALLNENGDVSMTMIEWTFFERYIEFRKKFPIEIHGIEENLIELGMGGTLDRDITFNGKRYILDIKTSGNIWDEFWLQMAAYYKMKVTALGFNPYAGRAILWLNAKTRTEGKKDSVQGVGWQMIFNEDDIEDDWKTFQATKLLWDKLNKNLQPKKITYQLSHKL